VIPLNLVLKEKLDDNSNVSGFTSIDSTFNLSFEDE